MTVSDNGVEDMVIIDVNALLPLFMAAVLISIRNYVQNYAQRILSAIDPDIHYSNCVNVQFTILTKYSKMAVSCH